VNTTIKIILVSFWFVTFIAFIASTIWGRMAERNYKAAMSPAFRWLYPAGLREKEVNVRFQKGMVWFGLFFVTFVYMLALASILRGR
jgi:Ni,Fe-hydrogenase I cytochrome b subunit